MHLLLINPNTSRATTESMAGIARNAMPGITVECLTAPFGVPLITNATELALAAEAVAAALAAPRTGIDGIVIAAFGDPALQSLRQRLAVPVTGIAEAGMAEAGQDGRRFAVVTTTPDLVTSIAGLAEGYGHGGAFLGTVLTKGDIRTVMADPDRLAEALLEASRRAVREFGADAVVIGGGPLALAARRIGPDVPVPLIEPVPAAVRLAVARAAKT
ncbi:aspartate/glutamate racemase family protein [Phreatobacter stygius]|uniref:Hydrogenase expression protein HupH n=1 Tax=Phreatobacter stygius TaxID=1940610 RepID=A0A4D7BH16_9HYPH|nr:aspartate/glutamate racemase family protein [Phreatobacter stygius]QCI68446.1 hydrogenase expression protein HupH [Phreatobacter stygius]